MTAESPRCPATLLETPSLPPARLLLALMLAEIHLRGEHNRYCQYHHQEPFASCVHSAWSENRKTEHGREGGRQQCREQACRQPY